MANQYGTTEKITQKCADPGCSNMITLTPSRIKKGKKYCSDACARKRDPPPRRYSEEDIAWIKENSAAMTRQQMADHFGVKLGAFAKMLYIMRQEGKDLPKKVTEPWKATKPEKPIEKQRTHHVGKPAVSGTLKRKEPVFATRVVKEEGTIPVVFNDKNRTRFTARDEAHAERIRATYAYLNKDSAERIREQK